MNNSRFCEICCEFKEDTISASFDIGIAHYEPIMFRLRLCASCAQDEDVIINRYLIPACEKFGTLINSFKDIPPEE